MASHIFLPRDNAVFDDMAKVALGETFNAILEVLGEIVGASARPAAPPPAVAFTVEIVRIGDGASYQVLHRAVFDRVGPLLARAKADTLLIRWRHTGANAVRIFNADGEQVYSWKITSLSAQQIEAETPVHFTAIAA